MEANQKLYQAEGGRRKKERRKDIQIEESLNRASCWVIKEAHRYLQGTKYSHHGAEKVKKEKRKKNRKNLRGAIRTIVSKVAVTTLAKNAVSRQALECAAMATSFQRRERRIVDAVALRPFLFEKRRIQRGER